MAMMRAQVVANRSESVRSRVTGFGQSLELLTNPWGTLRSRALCPERISTFGILGRTCIIVADPDLIRAVLSTRIDKYQKDPLTYSAFKPILGNGLILTHGALWKRQRSILARAFRAELLHHVVKIADDAVERLIADISVAEGRGVPFDFLPAFRSLTLQVIAEAILSLPAKTADEVFPKLYLPLVEEANLRALMPFRRYLPTPGNFKFRRALDELDSFLLDVIDRRHREGNPLAKKDILDRMLTSEAESGEPWSDASRAQIRDEIKTFLLAGHETTSAMLTWALFELTRHPAMMERVIDEADALFDGKPTAEAVVKGLRYTEAVLRETARHHTGVPVVGREAVEDDQLGKYAVAKGTKIIIALDAVHHDPNLWPDPERFDPSRFLGPLPHPYAFLAFLVGPRSCIGEHFALIEAKIVLARLVKRFRFLRAAGNEGRAGVNVPITPSPSMLIYAEKHT